MAQHEKQEVCSTEAVVNQAHNGRDISAKFNAECSPEQRREFFQNLQANSTPVESRLSGTHAAAKMGDLTINYNSTARTLDFIDGPGGKPLKFDNPALSMDKPAQAKVGDKATAAAKPQTKDAGRPGIDDGDAQFARSILDYKQKDTAKKIAEDILGGKDVSETVNGLKRNEKPLIMSEVKAQLAEKFGPNVTVSQESSGRSTMMVNGNKKLLITEDKFGSPTDIQYNSGGFVSKIMGASDLYNRPGESKSTASGDSGPSWLQRLTGPPLDTSKGALGKMLNGENLTDAEQKQIDDLKKKGLVKDATERQRE